MPGKSISRRRFLKTAGVTLALPLLEAHQPVVCGATAASVPRRLVAICYPIGLYAPNFFPEQTGRDYLLSPYLKVVEEFRPHFTVFSGLSHPRIARTHTADVTFLTGAPFELADGFRNGVSLDQVAAAHVGSETRFPVLTLGPTSLSFTPTGVKLPTSDRPSEVFARLFLGGNARQSQAQIQKLREGRSILDVVGEQARDLQRDLPASDRTRVEDYFSAVRELEKRMARAEEWEKKPKPKVDVPPPRDVNPNADPFAHLRLMVDLIHLALQTDSTRVVALHAGLFTSHPVIEKETLDYHNLSHHGKDPEKIKKLSAIETELMQVFRGLLAKLRETKEADDSLLDRTMVLLGSNLGNANSHDTTNLPILLAGGGFKHGEHLAFSPTNNTPLCNLYVSMLQRLGMEVSSFGSGKSALKGLEF